jgi:2-beta-glucuronyltransferase
MLTATCGCLACLTAQNAIPKVLTALSEREGKYFGIQLIESRRGIGNVLFISVHDFRSLRKASVHFIAAELATRGVTRFFSPGLSHLSEYRGDTRADLADRANRVEIARGVECYLWRSLWHPFKIRNKFLSVLEPMLFRAYRAMMPRIPRRWIAEADVVFVESGMAAVFIADAKRLNPSARIIYLASDDLDVVGCAPTIKRDFERTYDMIDTVRLPSRYLLAGMPHGDNAIFVPHGVDRSIAAVNHPSPYGRRIACVSLGSMLFDAGFFAIAAQAFPEIDFHIIGAGKAAGGLATTNVIIHPEMAFAATLPYLQHATFGIAPYLDADTPMYLIDTSLKLVQFALFGIPAVCPFFAIGGTAGRFGYLPGNAESIETAIRGALGNKQLITTKAPAWNEVVDRILHPADFADTRL